MTVAQVGTVNTAALSLPGLLVQIQPPPPLINGLPTNILGKVGVASWGPVNSPVIIGDPSSQKLTFGPSSVRKYDLSTNALVSMSAGANNLRCVRVTDGTDVAATIAVLTNCITYTGKYTGTVGNGLQVTHAAGSKASTQKITVTLPGYAPEVFDNVGAGLSGNALWVAMAAAINNGVDISRGASRLIVATAGVGTTAVAAATYSLAGGTDGATTITAAVLLGQDTVPRKGMYALRNTGCSVVELADADDSTSWVTQIAFGATEGCYMCLVGPAGDTISNAVSAKATAGVDNYIGKLFFGDWCYWADGDNQLTRLVSPAAFGAGELVSLSPEQSSLNKQITSVVGTQKSFANQVYSDAELTALSLAGIEIITNPIPAGNKFGCRMGINTSSNAAINGDNYTRMTNFIAYTLNASCGLFVGGLQSQRKDDKFRRELKSTVDAFLSNLKNNQPNPMIDDFSTKCDLSNNSFSRIALGYCQLDALVRYMAVVAHLIINIQGGQSVVTVQSITPQQ